MQKTQSSLQEKLEKLNTKIASGKKIQNSYDNSRIYTRDLQLGYQETTLSQGIDVAQNAYNSTLSTDTALAELSKSAMDFNTKLLQIANQPQSSNSRLAIAKELESIKNHMVDVANTSIGGDYLFSGTRVKTAPISQTGQYLGNDQNLEALIGSDVKIPYNIPGSELFLGHDADYSTSITSNIKKYNLSKLHPSTMNKINKDEEPQQTFITRQDTLRDLLGDNDDDPTNDVPVFFYLRGVRPDGTRFKSKFSLEKAFNNPENSAKVEDLLEKIGKEYGNNQSKKVVDVQLNPWGEIEVKSLVAGSSNLGFNLLASEADVEEVSTLSNTGAKVTSFQQSPYTGGKKLSFIQGTPDTFAQYQITLPTTFISQKTRTPATSNTYLNEVFTSDVVSVNFDGNFATQKDGRKITPQILNFTTKDTKISDVLQDIKTFYGSYGYNVEAEIADGKIILVDLDAKDKKEKTEIHLTISTNDANGNTIAGIPTDYQLSYDDVYFQKNGSLLTSNVSQVLLQGTGYATNETKLQEVAGNLTGKNYQLNLKDHNGVEVNTELIFNKDGVYLVLPSKDNHNNPDLPQSYKIPVLNLSEEGATSLATPETMTYRQLMDTIGVALNFSNQKEETYQELTLTPQNYSNKQKELYEKMLLQSQSKISIQLNQNGQVEVSDRVRGVSQLEVSFFDSDSDDFSQESIRNTESGLLLHANNALTIDKPQLNLFDALDEAITAVKEGIYRPDDSQGFGRNMRNIGIQNSLQKVQHIQDHIEKMIAINGSNGKSLENAITRNETLKVQVQNLRAENMDADVAEAYTKFQNLSTNYSAALSSAGKINKMSILDYV